MGIEKPSSQEALTFRRRAPLSGLSTGRYFRNPNLEINPESEQTIPLLRDLGKILEKGSLQVWSGEIGRRCPDSTLSIALSQVLRKTERIKGLKVSHHELAEIYQEEFAHGINYGGVPFLPGDSDNSPTFAPLAFLLEDVDKIFGTDLFPRFTRLGPDPLDIQKAHPRLRYIIEASIILAKLTREDPPFNLPHWNLIPDVIPTRPGLDENSNLRIPLTQLDGIFLPKGKKLREKEKEDHFDLLKYCQTKNPWGILEIRTNNRVLHVTGRKIGSLGQALTDIQDRLTSIISSCPDPKEFNFPLFAVVVYLRGTMEHNTYVKHLGSSFFAEWANILEFNLKNGSLDEKGRALAPELIFLLRKKSKEEKSKEVSLEKLFFFSGKILRKEKRRKKGKFNPAELK